MIKARYKAIILLTVFIIVTSFQSVGQVGNLIKGFVSNDQAFIKSAVDSATFIIRQDYVLVDKTSGTEYGSGGHTYFGRIYQVAVLSNERLYVSEVVNKPWEADSNFSPFAAIDTIIPKKTATFIKPLNQKSYKELDDNTYYPLSTSELGYFNCSPSITGLMTSPADTADQGWVVLIQTKDGAEINDESLLTYAIYKAEPGFNDSNYSVVKTQGNTKVLGGFFIRSSISTGMIKFIFNGIVINNNNRWIIVPLPEKKEKISTGNVLTPIKPDDGNSSKDKKIPRNDLIDNNVQYQK
jgi:hypothetical protein